MPLTVYRRGEIWHYRGTVAGRRLRGSTKTADKRTAQRIAAEIEARQWKGHLDGPASVLTFAQAAIKYRESGKGDRFLSRIEDYWQNTPVLQILPTAIKGSARVLYPHGSGASWNRAVLAPTQAVINHAAEHELCPRIRVRRFPVEKKVKKPATWPWVSRFMAHANPHLGALACFMFLTGARIGEALALTWDDVNMEDGRALIRQTKTATERLAHMPPELVAALAKIPDRTTGTVFKYSHGAGAVVEAWKGAIRRAGITPLSFHSCRHGFATGLLHRGVDPVTVAKRGGWRSPAHVFATYGHATEDETVTDLLTSDTPQTQTQASRRKA